MPIDLVTGSYIRLPCRRDESEIDVVRDAALSRLIERPQHVYSCEQTLVAGDALKLECFDDSGGELADLTVSFDDEIEVSVVGRTFEALCFDESVTQIFGRENIFEIVCRTSSTSELSTIRAIAANSETFSLVDRAV